jgi:hypothetical protein
MSDCTIYSPINISESDSNGSCTDKCNYHINYKTSSLPISNQGNYLKIKYDNTDPPVKFNTDSYKVDEIRIYSPSLHTYNGAKVGGEMVIIHTPVGGGKQLFVCIPIRIAQPSNPGSEMISTIITSSSLLIPTDNDGNSKTLDNIKNFNLNLFVPKKTFFYYEGVNFLDINPANMLSIGLSCPQRIPIDVICYLPFVSNISISLVVMSKLKKMITESGINPQQKTDLNKNLFPTLFVSVRGATTIDSSNGDDIVMDCQPYEISEETVDVVTEKDSSGDYSPKEILNSQWFQIIAGSLVFFLILCILNFLFGLFKSKSGSGGSDMISGMASSITGSKGSK